MAWAVIKDPGQDVIHIIPCGDFEPHSETETCRCAPVRQTVEQGNRDLLVHFPYDENLLGVEL